MQKVIECANLIRHDIKKQETKVKEIGSKIKSPTREKITSKDKSVTATGKAAANAIRSGVYLPKSGVAAGRKIKANVQRLSKNINSIKRMTPVLLKFYNKRISEEQQQLIILERNLQEASAKDNTPPSGENNSNSNNNLPFGRAVTSRNTKIPRITRIF